MNNPAGGDLNEPVNPPRDNEYLREKNRTVILFDERLRTYSLQGPEFISDINHLALAYPY